MTAQDKMKQLVADELRPLFKARGFRSRGLTFHRALGENYAIVQLQRSQSATASSVGFTVNLGVFSGRVQRALSRMIWLPDVKGAPTEPTCHLRQRIGFLLPEQRDVWWTVSADADVSERGRLVRELLVTYAFPFLGERTSDEGLRDHWLQRPPGGPAGLALAVLLRDLGPREMLRDVLERLRDETPAGARPMHAAIDRLMTNGRVA